MTMEDAKRAAATAALEHVDTGMVVGLGTGSTAAMFIEALGDAVEDGLTIRGVPTSVESEELARARSIPIEPLASVDRVDLAVDGADQVTPAGPLIKGGGGAVLRERLVAAMADRFIVIVDAGKRSQVLDRPVPVVIAPVARTAVRQRLLAAGAEPTLREAASRVGPTLTDDHAMIIDADFGAIEHPRRCAETIDAIDGVWAHGLWPALCDRLIEADDSGAVTELSLHSEGQ
jgi:ribose 5-phosphate isomerase A